jgi:hypothetical protein
VKEERKTYESHNGLQILVGGIPGGLAYSFALYAKYIPIAKKIIYGNGENGYNISQSFLNGVGGHTYLNADGERVQPVSHVRRRPELGSFYHSSFQGGELRIRVSMTDGEVNRI